MRSGLMKLLAIAMLMLPGITWADFLEEHIGQAAGANSLLLQPAMAFAGWEPITVMFPGPYDATRFGLAMSYTAGSPFGPPSVEANSLTLSDPTKRFAATAIGELTISERVGVFGKFGLRYSSNDVLASTNLTNGAGYLQQVDQRYGVGVNVRASEVLSLQFEWERHSPGGIGVGAGLTKSDWDPWKEKNVFGAGVRFGF